MNDPLEQRLEDRLKQAAELRSTIAKAQAMLLTARQKLTTVQGSITELQDLIKQNKALREG